MMVVFIKTTLNTIIDISGLFLSNYFNFKSKNSNKFDIVIILDIINRLEILETRFEKQISFASPVRLKDTSAHLHGT